MINAVLPIFSLILIGNLLKRTNWINQIFWDEAEKITYYILFPALLISKVAVADLSKIETSSLALTVYGAIFIATILAFATKKLMTLFSTLTNPSFSSFYQGSIRFNTYIGLALVNSIFGEQGLVIAVMIATLLIPLINIKVVTVLHFYGNKPSQNGAASFIRQLLTNPLILSCLIGILINQFNIKIPVTIFNTLTILGSTALPIGLLCIGAALTFIGIQKDALPITLSSLIKLVIYPLITYLIAVNIGLDQKTTQIATIFCALPTASAAYILAKSMGGDSQLMARIITLQTLFSLLTLLIVLSSIGL